MTTISIQDIGLRPGQLRAIEKLAERAGQTPSQYLRSLVERDLLASKSFDDILRPIRKDVRSGGLTENQLDAIVERAKAMNGIRRGLKDVKRGRTRPAREALADIGRKRKIPRKS